MKRIRLLSVLTAPFFRSWDCFPGMNQGVDDGNG